MNKRLSLLFLLAGLAGRAFAASVNGVAIGDPQVAAALKQAGLSDRSETRAAVKNQLIARELLRQEAAKKDYGSRPEAMQAAEAAGEAAAIQLYLREAVRPAPVTEAQVKARFDAVLASLGDKEFKARVIAVGNAADANALLEKIKAGADFARLAREHGKAPSAARGGELDWVSFKLPAAEGATQGLPLPLAQAISQLPAGAVSLAPVAVGNQRYLVKVDAVRPTQVPHYEQAAPAIRAALERAELERATAQLVAGLIKDAKISQ